MNWNIKFIAFYPKENKYVDKTIQIENSNEKLDAFYKLNEIAKASNFTIYKILNWND